MKTVYFEEEEHYPVYDMAEERDFTGQATLEITEEFWAEHIRVRNEYYLMQRAIWKLYEEQVIPKKYQSEEDR